MRLFRVVVPVRDLARSRAFYEAVLGLDVDDTVPTRLYFHCGDVILAVVDPTVEQDQPHRPNPELVYLATDELDSAFARAEAAGARHLSPIEVRPWGERSFYCQDPDGNPLCFVDDQTLFTGRGAAWA